MLEPGRLRVVFAAPDTDRVADALAQTPGVEVIVHPLLFGAALRHAAATADVLVVRAVQSIDRQLLEGARGGLRAVVQGAAGSDNIDRVAAAACGVEVLVADPGNATAVAEWTLLALLALFRGIRRHWDGTTWDWSGREDLPDRQLAGKTLGIVGLGRCGTRVARRARAFEMTIWAFDPYIGDEVFAAHEALRAPHLADLIQRCDALTLHCPLTDETRGMIGARELEHLRRGAILLNGARGEVVQEGPLLDALESGALAGAALDVYAHEPAERTRLTDHPNVLATPHLAGHTVESHVARAAHLRQALRDVVERLRGGR